MKINYRTITSYRVLPPKWRIIEPEAGPSDPAERYLQQVDQFMQQTQNRIGRSGYGDLASQVFANQELTHEIQSRQLAHLIEERRDLTKRQLSDIQRWIEDLRERTPLRPPRAFAVFDGEVLPVEKQILDLEKQRRALEQALWRDTQELRTTLVEQNRERHAARQRFTYLAGRDYGGE